MSSVLLPVAYQFTLLTSIMDDRIFTSKNAPLHVHDVDHPTVPF